jgi:lysophospholipase L1-like esterase
VHTRFAPLVLAALFVASCGGSDPEPLSPSPGAGTISYVALGDSAGFGIGALPGDGGYPPRVARRLRDAGREADLVNLSIPGATARDLASVQVPALASLAPTLVTVCIGANDAGDRAPADFAADLETIFAEVAKLQTAVVVCNVPDVSLTPRVADDPADAARVAAEVVALNAELARVAAKYGLPVADIYRVSREQLFANPALISRDGFHPSAAGYEVWAEAMMPAVRAVLGIQ